MAEKSPLVNRKIRSSTLRVIDPDGNQLGILKLDDALSKAEDFGLDLVEVAPMAKPPVCRIMDYGKYKYQQKKRLAEAKKNSTRVELKEIKVRLKTGSHDIETKLRQARKFLEEKNKVKFTLMFRGRESRRPELAEDILLDIADAIADVATVEQVPKMESNRNMTMYVAPGGTGIPIDEMEDDQDKPQ